MIILINKNREERSFKLLSTALLNKRPDERVYIKHDTPTGAVYELLY